MVRLTAVIEDARREGAAAAEQQRDEAVGLLSGHRGRGCEMRGQISAEMGVGFTGCGRCLQCRTSAFLARLDSKGKGKPHGHG